MKKILLSSMLIATATIVFAQEKQLQIWHNGNITHAIDVSQIDSINFGELLPAPVSVTAELTYTGVNIQWSSVEGATDYDVYRSIDNVDYTLLQDGLALTAYKDMAPLVGTNWYKVTARNASSTSLMSEASPPVTYPDIPEIEMITVEGGTFTMGETGVAVPTHEVTLSSFAIATHEVTQKLWLSVMGVFPGGQPDPDFGMGDNHPAYYVNYADVQEFIAKLNELTGETYRLPTEAEWEFAARGGNLSEGYTYSGSNNPDEVAWSFENSASASHEVGAKLPNELGIYDMSGNVWEWCSDWQAPYSSEPQTNPQGPETGYGRIDRGGSWDFYADPRCRVSFRGSVDPISRSYIRGFRLAQSL